MLNQSCLQNAIAKYKDEFDEFQWKNEKYKWEAVKWFQDHWNANSPDFAEMLNQSLAKTNNLLTSRNSFPRGMIVEFAKIAPEEVRAMFIALYDESEDVYKRIAAFKEKAKYLHQTYRKDAVSHFQDENTITTYLWLRYPDKYYIFKFGEARRVAEKLEYDYHFKKGAYTLNVQNCYRLYNEINNVIKEDAQLNELLKSHLTETCYPDPELITLTIDIGFFISRFYNEKTESESPEKDNKQNQPTEIKSNESEEPGGEMHYWWLNANPKIWSFSNIDVGEVQDYTLFNANGNKRRIFQNFLDAKTGDMVIGYESNPVKQIVAIGRISAEQDGEKLYFEKIEGLVSPIDYATLKECPELEHMEYFLNPQGSLFKLTKSEYDFIVDMIREDNPLPAQSAAKSYTKKDFLDEVYMTEERYDILSSVLKNKKNIILQGAPGVGKTFSAKRLAYSLMGKEDDSRIEFVQFHQNYSYEDFVMGYKPVADGFDLKNGVFYRFCRVAENQPDKDFFFIIDEINRGNLSKIFGELLMLIERDYRGTKIKLAYSDVPFAVPKNLYIIGMMNTADRSLAMIDYALRRRFSFFEVEPGFDSEGFIKYQNSLDNDTFDLLVENVKQLNQEITQDKSLGKGFCIGHSYFCGCKKCTKEWLRSIVDYDILPMLGEYWFDEPNKLQRWTNILHGVFQ